MENELLRKLIENMKRLQKEGKEERSRLPLLSSTTEEWRCAENCQVSRHTEMHVGQDLGLKMRSHQIVQTKTERLEVDLKRARDQSYIKTMEMSKLLTEKEELEVKIQELINKNKQLAKEKEELCEEYEEKLSRKISSDELKQLEKARQENKTLSCKLQKYAGEKAELLRENNDLKEELYRKISVMAKLTLENQELQMKTEMLTFKNIELTDENEELCREYDEILWREKQQRKGCCTLFMEKETEVHGKTKPTMAEYQLNKEWLKASVDNLKVKKSKESGPNILRWLQQTLQMLKEDSSKLSRYTLPEWLKESTTNLPKESAGASGEDVNGWLGVSLSHLGKKGPETCDLDVQGWLEASIIGIQHLQKSKSQSRGRRKKAWLENSTEHLKKQCPGRSVVNLSE